MTTTLSSLIAELAKIKDQLSSTGIPLTVDGKEIESVVLVTEPKLKVEIKTKAE